MDLATWPLPTLRVSCKRCDFSADANVDELRIGYGEDFSLRSLFLEMLKDCEHRGDANGCGMFFTDALLVDAILEKNPDRVLRKDLIPEANEWREKLGLVV